MKAARVLGIVALLLCASPFAALPALAQSDAPENDKDGDGFSRDEGDCKDNDPLIHPGALETCNDKDDDCDGETDEGNPGGGAACDTGDPGICGPGVQVCEGGALRCRSVSEPRAEACGNGLDDDCDGTADLADPDCVPGCPDADGDDWAVCSGACVPRDGESCGDCDDTRGSVNPDRSETCNGRDDDCDGSVDEGNPAGGSCETGLPGICGAGTLVCAGGVPVCDPVREPRAEICGNGEDDDCDGKQDGDDPSCDPGCQGRLDEDTDGDGHPDCADVCPGIANPGQADFDGDGLGDACESGAALADADGSGRVDGHDLVPLARAFGRSCGSNSYARSVDLDRDCTVDGADLALLAASFGLPR